MKACEKDCEEIKKLHDAFSQLAIKASILQAERDQWKAQYEESKQLLDWALNKLKEICE